MEIETTKRKNLNKPLGIKAYGSIPHLPGSRMGPADHHCHEGQRRIATERVRDKHDEVIVQEKLDGSCVAAVRMGINIVALGRSGYTAESSPYKQHQYWAAWVRQHEARFMAALKDGERMVGEWLAQAHGTIYKLHHEPFVAFDVMNGPKRLNYADFEQRAQAGGFVVPRLLSVGPKAFCVAGALDLLEISGHGAVDPVEGAVWRVERKGVVDFLCKYVRPDKVDGKYLDSVTGKDPIWNWTPDGK